MRPTFANLNPYKGKTFVMGKFSGKAQEVVKVQRSRKCIKLSDDGGALSLSALESTTGDSGMFVCFLGGKATYGMAQAGETWAASGPFSGCQIALGTMGGRIFLAHIAMGGGSTAKEAFGGGAGLEGAIIWAQWKVPMPDQGRFSGSYVFIDWSAGVDKKTIKIVRLDYLSKSMGGSDGEIFNIVSL